MRTTLAVDDQLLANAKRRAREQGVTLGQLVEQALVRELSRREPLQGPSVPTFVGGSGPRAGVELNSNREVRQVLDEGLALEQLR